MGYRRHKFLDLDSTNYYHCITRCVRRSYLCGIDPATEKDYNYRKLIIKSLIKLLTSAFSIEICSYAVMCNHIHLVLYVNKSQAESLGKEEVLRRWSLVYPNSASDIQTAISNNENNVNIQIENCRNKLFNISFFMEKLCVTLARQFNKEDNCKGRFWEGRFQSIPIFDLQSLINTMTYVDLNPIRAKMVSYPEEHESCSINDRFIKVKNQIKCTTRKINNVTEELLSSFIQEESLFKFGNFEINNEIADFSLYDYFKSIDFYAQAVNSKNIGLNKNLNYLNIFERLLI